MENVGVMVCVNEGLALNVIVGVTVIVERVGVAVGPDGAAGLCLQPDSMQIADKRTKMKITKGIFTFIMFPPSNKTQLWCCKSPNKRIRFIL